VRVWGGGGLVFFGGAPIISAAKAFIVSFGRGADEELRGRRVEREEKTKLVREREVLKR